MKNHSKVDQQLDGYRHKAVNLMNQEQFGLRPSSRPNIHHSLEQCLEKKFVFPLLQGGGYLHPVMQKMLATSLST
jgi:hypothetical protein